MPQWIRVLAAILVAFCAAAILISPAAELPDFTTAVKAASAIGHAHAVALHVLLPSAQTIQFGTVLVDVRHRPTLPIRFQALLSLTCALLC
jgi:hypothetical protein